MSKLSAPTFFEASALRSDSTLSDQITELVNASFHRAKAHDPDKWEQDLSRFHAEHSLADMLGDDGVMAVIFDQNEGEMDGKSGREVVACAAAIPWGGGWEGEGKGTEDGFEIKVVCVDGDAKYAKTGLAIILLAALEGHLILKQSTLEDEEKEKRLKLWVLAAECISGAYWRKRGYNEVRRKTYSGVWGCKTSFEMVVFVKEIVY